MRHIGWNTPYRFPAPKGAIENALFGLGYAFRALGMAFDTVGASMQLRGGELKETGEWSLTLCMYHVHLCVSFSFVRVFNTFKSKCVCKLSRHQSNWKT